jgi:hypothetical protein
VTTLHVARAMAPEEILDDLLRLHPGLTLQPYYGERSVFYNPGGARPLGVIFASIKEHDGPNDAKANLSRPGVFRFAFGLSRPRYEQVFGASYPPRPAKGEVVALPSYDLTALDELLPHPVYAWLGWVQVLSPTRQTYLSLRPLLAEALERTKARWEART